MYLTDTTTYWQNVLDFTNLDNICFKRSARGSLLLILRTDITATKKWLLLLLFCCNKRMAASYPFVPQPVIMYPVINCGRPNTLYRPGSMIFVKVHACWNESAYCFPDNDIKSSAEKPAAAPAAYSTHMLDWIVDECGDAIYMIPAQTSWEEDHRLMAS